MTGRQLSAATRLSRQGPAPTEQQLSTAVVSLRGPLGHSASAVISRLVDVLHERTGLLLREGTEAAPGTWHPIAPEGDYATSGKLRVCLASMAEVNIVIRELHGKAVNVGPDLISVEVANDVMDAPARQGNDRRRRAGRGLASANSATGA